MVYGGTAASALGSLLRRAQEERQTGPHLVPQSAQEESPIRQQITGPIVAPESMGSEKVVALKGEMQPIQEGATAAPSGIDGTANPVVSPVTPPAAEVMPPVTPSAPSDGGPTALSTIPSTFTPSGLGLSLMPSSMKPSATGSVLGKATSRIASAPSTSVSKYGNIPTGTITQGKPILSKSESVINKLPGLAAKGASLVSRAALGIAPMLIPSNVLKKFSETLKQGSAGLIGRGKVVKG